MSRCRTNTSLAALAVVLVPALSIGDAYAGCPPGSKQQVVRNQIVCTPKGGGGGGGGAQGKKQPGWGGGSGPVSKDGTGQGIRPKKWW